MEPDENPTPKLPSRMSPKDAYLEQILAEERDFGYVVPDDMDD
jgi:hypothetical protein